LTGRKADVLRLSPADLSSAEIAAELVLSELTVETHANDLPVEIGARDLERAVTYASPNGVIE
jgi:DNA-binding NarL/FixJ family response regulator